MSSARKRQCELGIREWLHSLYTCSCWGDVYIRVVAIVSVSKAMVLKVLLAYTTVHGGFLINDSTKVDAEDGAGGSRWWGVGYIVLGAMLSISSMVTVHTRDWPDWHHDRGDPATRERWIELAHFRLALLTDLWFDGIIGGLNITYGFLTCADTDLLWGTAEDPDSSFRGTSIRVFLFILPTMFWCTYVTGLYDSLRTAVYFRCLENRVSQQKGAMSTSCYQTRVRPFVILVFTSTAAEWLSLFLAVGEFLVLVLSLLFFIQDTAQHKATIVQTEIMFRLPEVSARIDQGLQAYQCDPPPTDSYISSRINMSMVNQTIGPDLVAEFFRRDDACTESRQLPNSTIREVDRAPCVWMLDAKVLLGDEEAKVNTSRGMCQATLGENLAYAASLGVDFVVAPELLQGPFSDVCSRSCADVGAHECAPLGRRHSVHFGSLSTVYLGAAEEVLEEKATGQTAGDSDWRSSSQTDGVVNAASVSVTIESVDFVRDLLAEIRLQPEWDIQMPLSQLETADSPWFKTYYRTLDRLARRGQEEYLKSSTATGFTIAFVLVLAMQIVLELGRPAAVGGVVDLLYVTASLLGLLAITTGVARLAKADNGEFLKTSLIIGICHCVLMFLHIYGRLARKRRRIQMTIWNAEVPEGRRPTPLHGPSILQRPMSTTAEEESLYDSRTGLEDSRMGAESGMMMADTADGDSTPDYDDHGEGDFVLDVYDGEPMDLDTADAQLELADPALIGIAMAAAASLEPESRIELLEEGETHAAPTHDAAAHATDFDSSAVRNLDAAAAVGAAAGAAAKVAVDPNAAPREGDPAGAGAGAGEAVAGTAAGAKAAAAAVAVPHVGWKKARSVAHATGAIRTCRQSAGARAAPSASKPPARLASGTDVSVVAEMPPARLRYKKAKRLLAASNSLQAPPALIATPSVSVSTASASRGGASTHTPRGRRSPSHQRPHGGHGRRAHGPERPFTQMCSHARPLRILCIDGGGVKGLNPTLVLKAIEERCNGRPIGTMFDLICGTSIGAAMAMVISLGATLDTGIHILREMAEKRVMAKSSALRLLTTGSKISEKDLDPMVCDTVSACGVPEPMKSTAPPPSTGVPHFFMTTCCMDKSGSWAVFVNSNYPRVAHGRKFQLAGTDDWPLFARMRAAVAAPTFFPPHIKDEVHYVDAAIVANNPTLLAVKEAQSLWPGRPIGCVVSLGCGKVSNRDARSPRSGLTYWAGQLLSMPMEVYRVHKEFQASLDYINTTAPPPLYFRLDPPTGEYELDESRTKVLDQMCKKTNAYIQRKAAKIDKIGVALLMLTDDEALRADELMQRLYCTTQCPHKTYVELAERKALESHRGESVEDY